MVENNGDAVEDVTFQSPNPLGVLGGGLAAFPNGRRVGDDVTDAALGSWQVQRR